MRSLELVGMETCSPLDQTETHHSEEKTTASLLSQVQLIFSSSNIPAAIEGPLGYFHQHLHLHLFKNSHSAHDESAFVIKSNVHICPSNNSACPVLAFLQPALPWTRRPISTAATEICRPRPKKLRPTLSLECR